MNTLEMKLLEKKVSEEQITQVWSEIVKNIQKAYCRGPLILDVANEADLDQNSELMVDKTAVKNTKIPKEAPSKKEEALLKIWIFQKNYWEWMLEMALIKKLFEFYRYQ